MKVCWFSAGVSSFIASWLERKTLDKVMYCHVEEQQSDTLRFLRDCEGAMGTEFEILQSPYKSVENVINKERYLNGPFGAKCTEMLKIRPRLIWEEGKKNLTYVWGYDATEERRAKGVMDRFPGYTHRFPLIERGLTKEDCHGMAQDIGVKRPYMYELGYPNNNCVGCVKGGMGYWNKIRKDFPETFALRARQEREIGHTCIKDVYLDELDPERGNMNIEIFPDCSMLCLLTQIDD